MFKIKPLSRIFDDKIQPIIDLNEKMKRAEFGSFQNSAQREIRRVENLFIDCTMLKNVVNEGCGLK